MAVLNREEYLATIQKIVGDDSSDTSLEFIANMTDTFDANIASCDVETRIAANDEEWRKKFKERFFNPPEQTDPDPAPKPEPKVTFKNLFIDKE